jgi:hypothetical protein
MTLVVILNAVLALLVLAIEVGGLAWAALTSEHDRTRARRTSGHAPRPEAAIALGEAGTA